MYIYIIIIIIIIIFRVDKKAEMNERAKACLYKYTYINNI